MTAKERKEYEKEIKDEKRRKFMHAKKLVEDEQKAEAERLEKMQENADMAINEAVLGRMNKFLMGGGVILFLSMALCVVGLLQASDHRAETYGTHTMTIGTEFAGHDTWGNFTNDCCCIAEHRNASDPKELELTVEKWICGNGHTKDRLREQRTVVGGPIISSLSVRPLCGKTFGYGCSPAVPNPSGEYNPWEVIVFSCASAPPVPAVDIARLW